MYSIRIDIGNFSNLLLKIQITSLVFFKRCTKRNIETEYTENIGPTEMKDRFLPIKSFDQKKILF